MQARNVTTIGNVVSLTKDAMNNVAVVSLQNKVRTLNKGKYNY